MQASKAGCRGVLNSCHLEHLGCGRAHLLTGFLRTESTCSIVIIFSRSGCLEHHVLRETVGLDGGSAEKNDLIHW